MWPGITAQRGAPNFFTRVGFAPVPADLLGPPQASTGATEASIAKQILDLLDEPSARGPRPQTASPPLDRVYLAAVADPDAIMTDGSATWATLLIWVLARLACFAIHTAIMRRRYRVGRCVGCG